ncbi:MAG: hypothetical protein ACREF3_02485, partial [Acetobacteraceae bacterium]
PTAGVDAKARREFWDLIGDLASEGMTVLVSTHYMDEAERCQRVVYLSGGRLIVQGTAEDVVRDAQLVVFETAGGGLDALTRRLRRAPGVENAAIFGHALRVVGLDRAALQAAVTSVAPDREWAMVPARLDDVFIHLLNAQESGE